MSQMDRRRALMLLAGLGVTGLSAACRSDSGDETQVRSGDPVRIGLLVPQTGGSKTIGDEIFNGFQLYVQLNGGYLGGHPVDLRTADEGDSETSGKLGLDKLLDDRVIAVTGVVSSSVMLAIRDKIRAARVPLVGSNASPVALQGQIYIWRTSYVNSEAGKALGPYVARQTRGRVAMVAPNDPAGQEAIEGFREGFGKVDNRLIDEPVLTGAATNPGKAYFQGPLAAIRAANPEAVFCCFAGPAAAEFIRQYREAGLTAKLYAAGFFTEGTILTELGDAAAGIVTALNYSADLPNGANRVFAAAYRKEHNASPTTYAMASYDAAQVLDKAINLAGENPTAQQVNLMLGKVGQIDSPRGVWQFNQSRTPQQKWYLREVRKDGPVLSNVLISELNTLG